jgi:hypothetical protein
MKTGEFDGDIADSQIRQGQPYPLGFDRRYLHPALPLTTVDAGDSAIQTVVQKSRTIASSTAMVRPLGGSDRKA